ncbi:MAG: cobyric acid synthase CobQ [Cyanobacteria bacterium RI_101]|nr:cobyric acid synthase CobQ [Cyanobacteria bacterium RI_101]
MSGVMVVGTTSHAGKTFLTTALCRLIRRRGYQVAPFKGQNMALNAYVTAEGGEMGHAQAAQAWAAGIAPRVTMNPILLKPQGDSTSQVILLGKKIGVTQAQEYYERYFDRGWSAITASLEQLKQEFKVIVCEGAGSPAEINLKHRDLTNMRVAQYLGAWTILVVDIDRGGAFAQVVGTLMLLEPQERALIKGVVINKFRGQLSILQPGLDWLEQETGIPVLGVIPYSDLLFPAEDSLSLLDRPSRNQAVDLEITVLKLPQISNFTDFDPLEAEPQVRVTFRELTGSLGRPDAVILPGTKNTLTALEALKASGMAAQLLDYVNQGGTLLGVCGGWQLLGKAVLDPQRLESAVTQGEGLGLFPLVTTISSEKITRQRRVLSQFPWDGLTVSGYEIHQGQTEILPNSAFQPLFADPTLGLVSQSRNLWGTYLHGLLENGAWRRAWLNELRAKKGLTPLTLDIPDYSEQRERLLDQVADLAERNLNLDALWRYLDNS